MFLSKHKRREKEAAWTARLLFPAELNRYLVLAMKVAELVTTEPDKTNSQEKWGL